MFKEGKSVVAHPVRITYKLIPNLSDTSKAKLPHESLKSDDLRRDALKTHALKTHALETDDSKMHDLKKDALKTDSLKTDEMRTEEMNTDSFQTSFVELNASATDSLDARHLTSDLRAGFSVSSRNFKKAVDRNRIKRLLRESYRKQKSTLLEIICREGAQLSLAIFIIYTGKELPAYEFVDEKMKLALKKLADQLR